MIAALAAFQVPVRVWQSLSPWLFLCGILSWCWCWSGVSAR